MRQRFEDVTKHFSVTIDCVRFLERDTYYMVISKTLENFLLIQKDTNFVEILIRKTIHYWQTSHIHRPYLIDNGCQPRLQFNSVCLIYFFFFHSYLDFLFRWWFDEHRASIEGKSPYKESYTVDSHWKMFCDVYQPNVA